MLKLKLKIEEANIFDHLSVFWFTRNYIFIFIFIDNWLL